ncbi:hypothetical protein MCOR15_000492 [Pyricularia oryzae]|nr:hypothetical protein MCOR15_000492 [Pyricularia oryzae]KAI6577038.1 hypothetical protein MCOR09_000749 [Pyricularia oryzae]
MDATDDGQFSIPSRRRENHRRLVPGLPGHRDGLLGRRMQSDRWAFGAVQMTSQAARTGRRAPVRRMLSGLAEEDAGNHKEMVLLLSRIMSDRPDAGRETLHKLQVEHRIDLITILGSRPWGDDMLGDAMWSSWGRMRDGAICSMPHGSGVYVDYKQDGSVAEVGLNGYFPTCNVTQSRSGRIVTESSAAEAAALLSTALVAVTCAGEEYQKYTSALGDFARRWLAHLEGSLGAQDLGDMLAWGGALPVVTMVGMLEPIPDAAKNLAVAARDVLARGGMQSLQCPILMSPTQTDYCASLRAVGSVADGAQPLRIYDSATEQIRRYEGGAPYCAVSYVWKEWDDDHLRAKLRWYAADGQGIFWVDRWCINQSDDEEKADQLAKMVHIYARAAETLVLVKSQQDISVTRGWDDLGKAWEEAAWHTRAWTYQEGACSHHPVVLIQGPSESISLDAALVEVAAECRKHTETQGFAWPLMLSLGPLSRVVGRKCLMGKSRGITACHAIAPTAFGSVGLEALEFGIVQIGNVMDALLTRESTSPDEVFQAALPLAGIKLNLEGITTRKDLLTHLINDGHIGTNILACCGELEWDGECSWVPSYDKQEPGLPSIGRADSSSCHASVVDGLLCLKIRDIKAQEAHDEPLPLRCLRSGRLLTLQGKNIRWFALVTYAGAANGVVVKYSPVEHDDGRIYVTGNYLALRVVKDRELGSSKQVAIMNDMFGGA